MTNARELAGVIDHTLLRPDAVRDDVLRLCREAREHGFYSVCVNPVHVSMCSRELQGSSVAVGTVVGFPLGASTTAVKVLEAETAMQNGAGELDMVMQIGALIDGDHQAVAADLAAVTSAAHEGGALVKVIIEAALLSDPQKETACRLVRESGAAFVKTSTGFSKGGATVDDVRLMHRAAGNALKVKAAGGIRTLAQVESLLNAGAARIGTSSGVSIMQECLDRKGAETR